MNNWSVRYETITEESAVEADCDMRYPHVHGNQPRWLTDYGENQGNGEYRNVSLHIPDNITPASRLRIARLIECNGA